MVEINLLPQQERRSTQPDAWRYATYALLPLTAAAILIPELLVGSQLGSLHREQDRLTGEIAALTPAKQEFDRLRGTQNTLEEVTAVAGQLRDSKTYWTNDVAAFSAQLPSGGGVAITSMNVKALDAGALTSLQQGGIYAGKNVVREFDLAGTARSQQSVVNFLNAYENSPNFAVNFRSLQQEGETGRYTFAASVGLVGQPGTAATGAAAATPGDAAAAASAPPAAPAGGANVR
ncbi:fimbrial assembly [Deinococcus phoenicis]|uniref:Fimbrial assembly n=1 Tax=Deinococcus phoenicis TaxID=1476583 RepID=A0A016QMK1_9DEIO|nr:fimbrial assembly protein [Deinococcus phoenicis]EYB67303.1 fimbrial assembly [Deinococcus phoenicis]